MNTKMSAPIEKFTLSAATFNGVIVEPTLINFFYGNNGTGKSTIAREIFLDNNLVWQQGKSADDYSVLVYNQEFIELNFKGYGNLKGVFTVGEKNIEIQNQISEKLRNELNKRSKTPKIALKKIVKNRRGTNFSTTFKEPVGKELNPSEMDLRPQ